VYASLLGEKIQKHGVQVWLINTGWSGGAFGTGSRIRLPYTRSMIRAALTGQLDFTAFQTEDYFGLSIPRSCPGVPPEILSPASTWQNRSDYDVLARSLIERFTENFEQFRSNVSHQILDAAPVVR